MKPGFPQNEGVQAMKSRGFALAPLVGVELVMGLALAFVLAGVAFTPKAALADSGVLIDGAFVVSAAAPSAIDFCTREGTPSGISIEARGIGSASRLGPLFLKITKCLTFPGGGSVGSGGVGTYAGTFAITAGNGDTLNGTYAGTEDFSGLDANGFGPFQGTLTVTGGTGRFSDASGVLSFTATDTAFPQVYYLVHGTLSK
jgi:hypothetical protein